MPKLGLLVKSLKKYAKNTSETDEDFLNAFLQPFITAGRVKDVKGKQLRFSKSRTSEIINCKIDVHGNLREALALVDIKTKTQEGMNVFVEDHLNKEGQYRILRDIEALYEGKSTQGEEGTIVQKGNSISLEEALTEILLAAIADNNIVEPRKVVLWKQGINEVEIISGDLFKYGFDNRKKKKNIVVIPVNTTFDTHLTRKLEGEAYPIVSENTLHGQWLNRIVSSGISTEQIDDRITDSIKALGFVETGESASPNGKKISYPIGTVAIIESKNAIYYLVAISVFDQFNNARSTPDDISKAVQSLLAIYDRCGQGYDLYMPLIGTGRSRAGLTINESYSLVTESLLKNNKLIHGHIFLVLRPEDREEIIGGDI